MNTVRVVSAGGQEWGRWGGVGPAMAKARELAGDNLGHRFTVEELFYDSDPPVWGPVASLCYPPRVPVEPGRRR